jgi:very-short-patch-repair endonuclease
MRGFVNPTHVKTHGMTCEEYRLLDPDAKFTKITAWNKGLTKETSESMMKASRSHQTAEYRARYEASMLEAHGVRHPAQHPDIMERILDGMKQANLERYGVENYGQTEEGRRQTAEIGRRSVMASQDLYRRTGYRTVYEQMFHEMNSHLVCNKAIGTGIGGKKRYGTPKFVPDFIDEERMVIYEIDGSWHEHDDKQAKDAIKTAFYESRGYTVVRLTNEEVAAMYQAWQSA